MSPSSTSEARKRREEATPPPEPLPGYTLTTRGEAARAGWECIDLDELPSRGAQTPDNLDKTPFGTRTPEDTALSDPWLVIARPPKPRKVTIELDEDVVRRWAGDPPDDLVLTTDPAAITSACRAALDGDK